MYGGRQLGKFAHHVAELYRDPVNGTVIRVFDCRQVGRSEDLDHVWTLISSDLQQFDITRRKTDESSEVIEDINAWLQRSAGRRLLILLDEMDAFMIADGKLGDPVSGPGQPEPVSNQER